MPQAPRPGLPLHASISAQISGWIEAGLYQPGERLPSEAKLIEQFDVSRITIRRALANLMQQGLVYSQRGKGVFVTERQRAIYSLSSPFVWFEEDIQRQGLSQGVETIAFEAIAPPETIRASLQLPESVAEVFMQKKFLLIDDKAAALDITYLVPELGRKFGVQLTTQMTFPTLEKNGVTIERIEALLSTRQADRDMADMLDLSLGSPLLVYEHTAYTEGNRPILCGETLSSGDRLAYSITLTK